MNLQQRIDDCLEDMANAYDYDDRQELLIDFIEMELLDQRQVCADDIENSELVSKKLPLWMAGELRKLCINAVEKK